MSEKRFKSTIDEDTMSIMPYLVSDKEEECFYNLEGCVDLLNEQQATIGELKEENSNLNSILNEVGLQKPFIKILDDYMIEYDGSCFSMHKPSDIRSFVYLMNRNNNFDELQCEYNDESMVIDDE